MRREGVFKNETVLSPEYLPDQLPGREREIEFIASAVRPAVDGRRPRNLFVFGGPGTGKTSSTKFVMKELGEASGRAVVVYVNCWHEGTKSAVLSKISQALELLLPRRGLSGEEVFTRAIEELKLEKKILVVFLDEVDSLAPGEEKLLYDLSRAGELFGTMVGLVCIANNKNYFASLDSRVRSSFSGTEVEFKQYSPLELKGILRERAKHAFITGTCPEEVIALCAAHAAKMGGDARVAIESLWFAGRVAEKKGHAKVELGDAREAIDSGTRSGAEKAVQTLFEQKLASLTEGERLVVEILRKNGELTSGDLYAAYSARRPESERTIRNYLDKLEAKKLIRVQEGGGSEGRTRKIALNL